MTDTKYQLPVDTKKYVLSHGISSTLGQLLAGRASYLASGLEGVIADPHPLSDDFGV
jgi:hypothetical protein